MDYNILVNVKYKNIVQTNYDFKQQDYGQKLIVTAEDYDINGTTARLFINKSDGTVNERIMTKENDSYTYILDADDTSIPGKTVFDVKYYKQGVRDSSASFIFNIIPDRFGNLIESKDFSDSLQGALDDVYRTKEIVDEYDEKIEQINKASGRAENAATNSVIAVANCEQATNKANVATDRANTAAATAEGIAENKTGLNDNAIGASTTWSSSKINTSLANQISTANGSSINLPNSYNGGLFLKELQGKSVQNGTPSPDNKVDIVSVGDDGSVVLKVCGKNLLSVPNGTYTSNGITITVADGIINVTGTAIATTFISIPFIINLNGTYTLSANNSVSYTDGELIRLETAVGSEVARTAYLNKVNSAVTFSASSLAITKLVIRTNSGSTVNYTIKPQLELSTVATTYEPYKEQLVTIPLTQPLRSVGSVHDRGCIKSGGLWGNERKFGIAIFDGSDDEGWEAWATGDGTAYRYMSTALVASILRPILPSIAGSIISDRYVTRNANETHTKAVGISVEVGGRIGIYDSSYNTNNTSLFKARLKSNPVTVVYELATPTFEPFSQSIQDALNKLQTYQGVTNVFTTDALQPNMIVEYGKTDSSALALYAENVSDNKLDKSKSVNNLITTVEGTVLDGRQGKALSDKIGNLSDLKTEQKTDLVGAVNEVNNNLTSISDELHKAVQKDNIDIDTLTNPGWYNCYGGAHVPDSSIRWNIKVEKETLANLTIIYQKAYYYMGGTGYVSPKTRHTYADYSGNLVYSSWI